ncbi:MAG: ADP-ribosylglycohydrolase family protein, partial [Gemmataceae bacterium]
AGRGGVELARRDSGLTHPNPVCRDSCAVFVAAISEAVVTGDRERAYAAALAVADMHPKVRAALEAARAGPPPDFATNMGHVIIALQNAFHQLLHAPSLEEGIVDTVCRGGDTDTNGAITGALLGAAWGLDAVPARWVRCVLSCRPAEGSPTAHPRAREFWPVDALELAAALLEAGR